MTIQIAACFVLFAGLFSVSAASQESTQKQIQSIYDRVCALIAKKDVNGLSKALRSTRTGDYTLFTAKKEKRSLSDLLSAMLPVMARFNVQKSSVRIDSLKVTGSRATAMITTNLELVSKAQPGQKPHNLGQVVRGEDDWVLVGHTWKLKLSKSLSENMYADGKLVPGA
jgi:hypothetical protein